MLVFFLSWLCFLPQSGNSFPAVVRSSRSWKSGPICRRNLCRSLSDNNNYNIASEESTAGAFIQRMALRQIFDGERNFLFTTKSNIRDYEWEKDKEVEDLLESILYLEEFPIEDFPGYTLELNQVNILQASKSTQDIEQLGGVQYDVFDGQQRIVTICLLIAAMRDVFVNEWGYEKKSDRVSELSKAIYPTKADPPDVDRITLRGKPGDLLHQILAKKSDLGKNVKTLRLPKPGRRIPPLSAPEKRLVENYQYLLDRLVDMGQSRVETLWSNIRHRTYFLVCTPASPRIARSMVLGLTKGKNFEPIDEFKQIVCFNQRDNENVQDETLGKWNDLVEDIGRKVVEDACLIYAQINTKRQVNKHQKVELMERFFASYLDKQESRKGSDFFEDRIKPAAQTLRSFREGSLVVPSDCSHQPSLTFLSQVTEVNRSKQIELLVIYFLMEASNTAQGGSNYDDELWRKLYAVERLALWMLTCRSKPSDKFERCWAVFAEPRHNTALELTAQEREHVVESLDTSSLGGSGQKNVTVAKIILERLNEYQINRDDDARLETRSRQSRLEYVMSPAPEKGSNAYPFPPLFGAPGNRIEDESDLDDWTTRFGNLAILHQKMGNCSFYEKKEFLKASSYPLTRRIAEYPKWDEDSLQKNHNYLLDLSREVWKL